MDLTFHASTPQEYFESCRSAHARKDPRAIYEHGWTSRGREELLAAAAAFQAVCKMAPEKAEKLRKMGIGEDPGTLTPEQLLLRLDGNEMAVDPVELTLLGSREEGEAVVLEVEVKKTRSGRVRKEQWRLVREGGSWKREKLR